MAMDPEFLSQRLIEVARRILKLEDQRNTVEEQIRAAKKEHLDLLTAGAKTVVLMPVVPTPAETGPAPEHGAVQSVRRQILRYVAANKPVEQTRVEAALAHLGATTVRQALYDMTSVKSGLLERTETGLVPSKKGLEVLSSAA
jgi:hypothetical protein